MATKTHPIVALVSLHSATLPGFRSAFESCAPHLYFCYMFDCCSTRAFAIHYQGFAPHCYTTGLSLHIATLPGVRSTLLHYRVFAPHTNFCITQHVRVFARFLAQHSCDTCSFGLIYYTFKALLRSNHGRKGNIATDGRPKFYKGSALNIGQRVVNI